MPWITNRHFLFAVSAVSRRCSTSHILVEDEILRNTNFAYPVIPVLRKIRCLLHCQIPGIRLFLMTAFKFFQTHLHLKIQNAPVTCVLNTKVRLNQLSVSGADPLSFGVEHIFRPFNHIELAGHPLFLQMVVSDEIVVLAVNKHLKHRQPSTGAHMLRIEDSNLQYVIKHFAAQVQTVFISLFVGIIAPDLYPAVFQFILSSQFHHMGCCFQYREF